MTQIRWCCTGFTTNFLGAGSRGIGVFAAVPPGADRPTYLLQFRAFDPGAQPPSDSQPMSSVVQIGIRFCPWCGRNLRKWYAKSSDQLLRNDLLLSGRAEDPGTIEP